MDRRSTNSPGGLIVFAGALATALGAGYLASLVPANPLGVGAIDPFVTVAFTIALAVAFYRATAPLIVPGLVLALAATSLLAQSLALIAILAFGVVLSIRSGDPAAGRFQLRLKVTTAARILLASCLANVMIRLDDRGHDRFSAYAVGAVVIIVILGGLFRLRPPARRVVVVVSFVIGMAGSAVAAGSIEELRHLESELAAVQGDGASAAELLGDGDFRSARLQLEQTRERLFSAQEDLRSGYTGVAMWVPGASQNLRAIDDTSQVTIELLDTSIALAQLGESPNIIDGGRITTEWTTQAEAQVELALLTGPIVDDLRNLDSVWFAPPISGGLADLEATVDEFQTSMLVLDDALNAFPGLAGYEGERRYLVLVGDPADGCLSCGTPAGFVLIELDEGAAYPLEAGRLEADTRPALDQNLDGVIRLGSFALGDVLDGGDPTVADSAPAATLAANGVLRELISAIEHDRVAMSVTDADERRLLSLLGVNDLADPFEPAQAGITDSWPVPR